VGVVSLSLGGTHPSPRLDRPPSAAASVRNFAAAKSFWGEEALNGRGGKAGCPAGYLHRRGYTRVYVDGVQYQAHRVIWLMMTGAWPVNEMDHRNRDKGDNRFSNLREATHSQNIANYPRLANNRSGFRGVCRDRNAWRSQIGLNGKTKFLGFFATPEAAHAEYAKAAKLLFGEYANSGSNIRVAA
jgi:hypothetical protein